MDQLRIQGGNQLGGEIFISGAKNAALPLMMAGLLTSKKLVLNRIPDLADVRTTSNLLRHHGAQVSIFSGVHGQTFEITASVVKDLTAPYDLVRKMRASVLVLGALVARCGEARVSLPGGCSIGTRPIDLHLQGLRQLGAKVGLQEGYIRAVAPGRLRGTTIRMPRVSVGATENLMMAASLAKGETIIDNAAREPEIKDLAICLNKMGALIKGAGTERIVILGVEELNGANHTVIADRIEAGTYATAATMTGGQVELKGISVEPLASVCDVLKRCGASISFSKESISVLGNSKVINATDISTQPYPGFPTDMQAQIMALLAIAKGASTITENIFENRFMHIPELVRMGADIIQQGSTAIVRGVSQLRGAPVMATDLRASVSLVLAGLVADGETVISRIYHLDRGYEDLVTKLAACGAEIERQN